MQGQRNAGIKQLGMTDPGQTIDRNASSRIKAFEGDTTTRGKKRDGGRDRTGRHDPEHPSMLVGPTPLQTTERGVLSFRVASPPCFNGGDRANPSAPRRPPHMASKPINNATRFSETGGRAKRKLSRAEHNDSASCPPLLSIQRPSPRHTPLEPLQCRPTCSRPHLPAKPPKAPSWRQ
jgi:hypothetical protein